MICGLCGSMFELNQAEAPCQGCWLAGACSLIRCPRCGFEMPPEGNEAHVMKKNINKRTKSIKTDGAVMDESATMKTPVGFFRGMTARVMTLFQETPMMKSCGSSSCNSGACEPPAKESDGSICLIDLELNQRATITRLDTSKREPLRQLLAMGILPHTDAFLVRKYPTIVLQIGKSQYAIDRELAEMVYVRKHIHSK